MLSEGLKIELPNFEAENAMLNGDYLRQTVEIVIGDIPTVLAIRFMCLFMSLGRILLKGSVLMNLFDPVRYQVDRQQVEDSIKLLGNIDHVAEKILPGIRFAPHLGRRLTFSICFLVYYSILHELRSQGIGFGLPLFAGLPE
jgi:hypothetical protein